MDAAAATDNSARWWGRMQTEKKPQSGERDFGVLRSMGSDTAVEEHHAKMQHQIPTPQIATPSVMSIPQQFAPPTFVVPQGTQFVQTATGEFVMLSQQHFQQQQPIVIHPVGQEASKVTSVIDEPVIQPVGLSSVDNKEKKSKRSRNKKNKNKTKDGEKQNPAMQPIKTEKVNQPPASPMGEANGKKESWKTCGNWRDAPVAEPPVAKVVPEPTTPVEEGIPSMITREKQIRKKIVRTAARELSRLVKSAHNPNPTSFDCDKTDEVIETNPEWAQKCERFSQAKGNYNRYESTGMLEPHMALAPTDANAVAWPAGRGRPMASPVNAIPQRVHPRVRIPLPKPQQSTRLTKSDDDDSSIGDGGSCDSSQALTSLFSSTQFSM